MDIQDFMPKPNWVVCVDTVDLELSPGLSNCDTFPDELADHIAVLPRTPLLEQACRYKQLVVYVVISQRIDGVLRTLVYQRLDKLEGEQRLAGKLSMGVGGHVEVRDFMPDVYPIATARPAADSDVAYDACAVAVRRELEEELLWPKLRPADPKPCVAPYAELTGWLYTPQDQVGRAHIGIVYQCTLPDDAEHATPEYGPGQKTMWLSADELAALDLDSCETWTRELLLLQRDHTRKCLPGEPTLADLLAAGAPA